LCSPRAGLIITKQREKGLLNLFLFSFKQKTPALIEIQSTAKAGIDCFRIAKAFLPQTCY
jgi:hypothetical protein